MLSIFTIPRNGKIRRIRVEKDFLQREVENKSAGHQCSTAFFTSALYVNLEAAFSALEDNIRSENAPNALERRTTR
jgi:hypothetical protein